jgi:purine-binding chemotaxis protein CheW
MSRKFVCFRLGDGQYAIALKEVRRIIRHENVLEAPAAPSFVEGVINLGGEVVPIVDLRRRFSLPPQPPSGSNRVLVVERDGRRYGLLVDSVREILELGDQSIASEASSVFGLKAEFVAGIAKVKDNLVVLLDIFRILSAPPERSLKE